MATNTKTVETPDTYADELSIALTSIAAVIKADVEKNATAKQSGAEVATTFDSVLPFNWVKFEGNKGADKCGLNATQYKMVKQIRDDYKTAWEGAELINFDQRWKYVRACSEHFIAPADTESRGKSTDAKLEEAVRSVLRHSTTLDDETMIDFGNQMCDYLGLEVAEQEVE